MVLLSTHFILNIFHDLCYIKILLISIQENFMSISNDFAASGNKNRFRNFNTIIRLGSVGPHYL